MIGWGKNRATQQPTGIGPQQFEKDHLGGCGCGRVSQTSPAKSSSVPDIDPIRGPIHRPAMTLRVDKGFQQHHAVPERCFPIPRQTPLTERENARPPIERCQSGRIRKRLLLTTSFKRAYCWRKLQPIQRSRAAHFSAEAEKLNSATHCSRQLATYQSVSPILGKWPR